MCHVLNTEDEKTFDSGFRWLHPDSPLRTRQRRRLADIRYCTTAIENYTTKGKIGNSSFWRVRATDAKDRIKKRTNVNRSLYMYIFTV